MYSSQCWDCEVETSHITRRDTYTQCSLHQYLSQARTARIQSVHFQRQTDKHVAHTHPSSHIPWHMTQQSQSMQMPFQQHEQTSC